MADTTVKFIFEDVTKAQPTRTAGAAGGGLSPSSVAPGHSKPTRIPKPVATEAGALGKDAIKTGESLASRGIGKTVGGMASKALSGMLGEGGAALGGTLGSLGGPIGVAVGMMVGTAIGKTVEKMFELPMQAIRAFAERADAAAESLRPFSAALNLATAEIKVRTLQRDIGRANRIGGVVAGYEVSKNDAGYQLQRIGDAFMKPILRLMTGINFLAEKLFKLIADGLDWLMSTIRQILNAIPGLNIILKKIETNTEKKTDKALNSIWEQWNSIFNNSPIRGGP